MSVFVFFPHGAMGWSVICDCGFPGQTHFFSSITTFTVEIMAFRLCPFALQFV